MGSVLRAWAHAPWLFTGGCSPAYTIVSLVGLRRGSVHKRRECSLFELFRVVCPDLLSRLVSFFSLSRFVVFSLDL